MAVRQRLNQTDEDTLPEGMDDLDAAYVQKLKEDGVDAGLVDQFMDLMAQLNEDDDK